METYRRHKRVPDPRPYVWEMEEKNTSRQKPKEWHERLHDLTGLGYDEGEQKEIKREISRLFRHFHEPVVYGARFRAPCPVWRSERIVLRNDSLPRFATRVCVFHGDKEYMSKKPDASAQVDEIGGFLGFISLRPTPSEAMRNKFIAVAHISCPSHMKRPRYHVLHTALGPPDGIMPFRGTPYYQPWVESGKGLSEKKKEGRTRAVCLQASLYSALLLKSSTFHCTPLSSHDLMAMLWESQWDDGANPKNPFSMYDMGRSGLTLEECEKVLRKPEVNGGCCVETVTASDFWTEALEVTRLFALKAQHEETGRKVQEQDELHEQALKVPDNLAVLNDEINTEILRLLKVKESALNPTGGKEERSAEEKERTRKAHYDDLLDDAEPEILDASRRKRRTSQDLREHIRQERMRLFKKKGHSPHLAHLISNQNLLAKREARLCISEYLANGMPVIASIKDKMEESTASAGHSVLVVGMHFQNPTAGKGAGGSDWRYEKSDTFLPSSYVVHDITQPPFWEIAAKNLLTAGWFGEHRKKGELVDRSFSYLAVVPSGTRCGIRQVRKLALGLVKTCLEQTNGAHDYVQSFKPDGGLSLEKLCLRTRLMSIHDILRWYVKPVANGEEPTEEKLAKSPGYKRINKLVNKHLTSTDERKQNKQKERVKRWWCVECHSESFRSSCFRDYNAWKEPLVVYCWRIDQELDDENQWAPEFTIRALKRGRSEFTLDGLKPIKFNTRLQQEASNQYSTGA